MDQEEKQIRELFRKYLYEQLTPDEIVRLKSLVAEMDIQLLDEKLEELWNDYTTVNHRNIRAFNEVSANLKAILQPREERSFLRRIGQIAAAILLPLFILSTSYLYLERSSVRKSISQEYQIIAEKGEKASVVLPDGTKVYLNSQSKLTYPASFSLNQRTVNLTGEAYFEVRHDASHPFVVNTPRAKVRVLGTTFNLYAYPEKKLFEASLVEGKVEVMPIEKPEQRVLLLPGHKASYDTSTGKIAVKKTDLRVETAWRRGDLLFHSQSFNTIVSELESFYGVTIRVDGKSPKELFTGTFHEDDINVVLRNLQQHYKFTYKKLGDEIILHLNK